MTEDATSIYKFTPQLSDGTPFDLSTLKGHPLLIANTATKCGFASQNEQFKELNDKLYDQGLRILLFPCDQFGSQEPNTDVCILENFKKIDDRLLVFKKIDVNGDKAEPIYNFLKKEKKGVFGSLGIKWNYTKFVVDKDGKVLKRASPTTAPPKLLGMLKDLCEGKHNEGQDIPEEEPTET